MRTTEIMHIASRRLRSRTLWSRLRRMTLAFHADSVWRSAIEESEAEAASASQTSSEDTVLPFPLQGEALLVTLAHVLRERFGGEGPDCDPSLFTISRGASCRLMIGRAAYVEFHKDKSKVPFRVAVEAEPDTIVSVQTSDFNTVIRIVVHYVRHELRGSTKFEAAS